MKTARILRKIADRSVLWKAGALKCKVLSGDGNLRKEAEEMGLAVHGSIWVIQQLVAEKIITTAQAVPFLTELKRFNDRLPQNEIDILIKQYSV